MKNNRYNPNHEAARHTPGQTVYRFNVVVSPLLTNTQTAQMLTQYQADGWELVAALPVRINALAEGGVAPGEKYIFRRPDNAQTLPPAANGAGPEGA